ncbi:aldose epimerase family protein [Asticcacaulis sp. ZE23SCel15]|uniref:aldose epimerase family protein n=1 Tax=Asticcacaulis sp. ZE23SCel15 TaxID=3059027 RepID=UPI00265F7AE6|nr:aldose epimerase family protein [Asticcacaulis sp. ZE23SCel15]WKL55946.1 aldose epimerase family protein [Asticcacaulis sp. ZE23SCel15]
MKSFAVAAGLTLAALLMSSTALAATATKGDFGALKDGTKIEAVELKNSKGVSAKVIAYGATLQSLIVPDKAGKADDIVIGYDTIDGYVDTPQYLGVTVGRYANRIALGKFTLDGKEYTLATNNNGNHLHGGLKGWDKVVWKVEEVKSGPTASVTLSYVSPDGEEGYPGTVKVFVTYALSDANDLTISYKATTDKPTVVNLTNHSLFNLGGVSSGRSALDATLQLEADSYLPTTATAIPTGEIASVKGTPFDFTTPALISSKVRDARHPQILVGLGIDHNYLVRGGLTKTPKLAVTLTDATSGRGLKILTTEPGVQMYTGNFLDGKIPGKGGQVTRMGDAVAFETQHYPDSPNRPEFPTTRLNPGQTYTQTTVHHLFVTQ